MSIEIVLKTNGSVITADLGDIVLENAGIVKLPLGPELVERFERVGDALRLVLKDGRTITIHNFFVVEDDGERNDLVLEDREDVLWWGQYTSPWSEFHFTEIHDDHIAAALLPLGGGLPAWAGLALGVIGGGVALDRFGSDGSSQPLPPSPPPPPVNGIPSAPDYSLVLDEDTSASGRVEGKDPDGDPLTYTLDTPPTNGSVVVNPDGSYTYTPDPDYNGPDVFTVTVDDGNGGTTTSTIVIEVTPVNDPPVAPDYSHTIEEDTPVSGQVTGTDVDGDPLTYTLDTPPSNGSVVVNPDGSYTYTPDPDYNGPDVFTVTVDDGNGGTTTSTIVIEVTPVNDPPVAPDYSHTIEEDTPVSGQVTGTDVDGDPLTYTLDTPPSNGSVVVNPDGSYTYTPDPDYNGPDVFTVTVDDGNGGTTTSTIVIEVTPVNDPPVAPDCSHTVEEDTPVSGQVTGTDVDGDPLTYTLDTPPSNGSVVVNPDGSYTYTPDPDYNGPDVFTVTVDDGNGGTTTSTIVIEVTPVNDPPVAPDYSHTVEEDTPVSGQVTGTDVDGDPLTYTLDTPPSNGSVVVNPDGSYTYTPDPDYNGPDVFTVTVDDGNGGTTTSTIVIEVTPVNDPPVAPDYSHTIEEDTPVSGQVTGTDVDGDPLTYTLDTPPTNGSVVVNPDGSYTYTPDPDYNGPDVFTVTVDDGNGGTTTSTIVVEVTPVNDPPVAPDYSHTIEEDTPVSGQVTGTDVDGDPLTYTLDTPPSNGSVVVNPDGSYTYTPDPDYNGPDVFTVTVDDGNGGTTTSTIVIEVTPVNDPPVAPDYSHTIEEDTPVSGQVTGTDVDGDPLTYTLDTPPTNGSVVVNPDGSYTYTPDPDYNGPDVFTVTVDDGNGGTTTSTVTIDVTPVNDPVTAADDSYTIDEDTTLALDLLVNDVAPDGGLTITSINGVPLAGGAQSIPVSNGTVEVGADGGLTFIPNPDYHGTVSFPYTIRDADGDTDNATVTIAVNPVNDAPVPVAPAPLDQSSEDAQTGIDVHLDLTGLFKDVDDPVLDYSISGLPPGLSFDPATGRITGDLGSSDSQGGPKSDGVYEVTLTATDPHGESASHTFTWTVTNPSPSAADDATSTPEDTLVTGNVLAGTTSGTGEGGQDSDPDGDTLQVTVFMIAGDTTLHPAGSTVTIPGVGDFTLHASGEYVFVPEPDWNGEVPIVTYTISDGEGGEDSADLTITVDAVDDIADDTAATSRGQGVTIDVLDNDDFEGTPVITAIDGEPIVEGGTVAVNNGNVVLNADGTLTFSPGSGYIGPASFTYTVTSGGVEETATVTVQVLDVHVTNGSVEEAGLTHGTTPGTGHTTSGSLNIPEGWTAVAGSGETANGTWAVRADGTYDFTLTSSTTDVDAVDETNSFTYTITNGVDTVTQTVIITIIDDAPKATDDTGNVTEGATLGVDAEDGVLSNDTAGADGWPNTSGGVIGVAAGTPGTAPTTGVGTSITGSYGTLTLNADGSYTYVSTADAINADAQDIFTYTVRDADGDETTATLTINVRDVTGAPTVTAGSVEEAGLPAGSEAASDSEIATGSLDLQSGWTVQESQSGTAKFGTWSVETDGTYTYTLTDPTTDVEGVDETDSFTYTAVDEHGNTVTNTVTVTIIDDVPSIDVTGATPGQVVVDETTLGKGSDWVEFAGVFNTPVYGADGEADTDPLVYTLVAGPPPTGLKDVATDSEITLSLNAETGNLEGVSEVGNHLVFTIAVNEDGKVQLTQHRAVTHPDPDKHDDEVVLSPGSVVLRATVTDGDGDTHSATVEIGGNFVFRDDGPAVTEVANKVVYESGLPSGSAEGEAAAPTSTGNIDLNVDFGADGAGSVVFTEASLEGLPEVTSGMEPISYVLADDGRTIIAHLGSNPGDVLNHVFTVTLITNGTTDTASYEFTLHRPLDHMQGDSELELSFAGLVVTDRDGDTITQGFTVVVHDDDDVSGNGRTIQVEEDSSTTFNTSADATAGNTVIKVTGGVVLEATSDGQGGMTYSYPSGHVGARDFHGKITVNANGSITYTPDQDYSNTGGSDGFTYTTTVGTDVKTVEVTVNVTPVSDAPLLAPDSAVTIDEDGQGVLGLKTPAVKDGTDQNGAGTAGDHGERLGAITLTPSGDGADGATFLATIGDKEVELARAENGTLIIVIVDSSGGTVPSALHVTDTSLVPAHGTPGVHYLTEAEYESIQARPAAESHENFTVTVDVTSYEVDDAGAKLNGVDGAKASQTVDVNVQAVTDPVELKINGGDEYTAPAVDEDSTINLRNYLSVELDPHDADDNGGVDLDGSQNHWFTITGLPVGAVVNGILIDSTTQSVTVEAPGLGTDATALPDINLVLPPHFAGDINGIGITLHVQDKDSDGPKDGVELTNSVTLNLRVNPVANDVQIKDPAEAPEDTPIAFLAGITLADQSSDAAGGGIEIITKVAFTLPPGFNVSADALTWTDADGGEWRMALPDGVQAMYSGNTVTLSSTPPEGDIEGLLGDITVTPPGHSSKDLVLHNLEVTTVDTATVGGTTVVDTKTSVGRDLTITVTPVAERTDTDSNGAGGYDVTMNDDHTYSGGPNGAEDQWFALGSNDEGATGGGWSGLGAPGVWTNEDTDEHTFAVLTPELTGADWAGDSADGSMFRYFDGSGWVEQTFNGTPVWVPAEYMDTLQFKAGSFVSGEFQITVQAATVDYDDDYDPLTPPTGPVTNGPGVSVNISGEATLTLITIDPVANDVTMSVSGGAAGAEDTAIPLGITATTLDPSETVTITIKDIPVGSVVAYGNGQSFTAAVGATDLEIKDYNGANSGPVSIKPPAHFSGNIPLVVEAQSVDGRDTSSIYTRTITVQVTGVADDVSFDVYAPGSAENPVVTEAALDAGGRISLGSLMGIPASADAEDGSETITLRISGLGDGFSLEGASLISGDATGADRIWSVSMDQFPSVKVKAPANFSGDAKFLVQGISTERDGDSKTMAPFDLAFRVSPSVDGVANTGNSALVEDEVSALGLHLVHQNGDDDERMGDVWIQADQVAGDNYTILLGDSGLTGTPEDIDGVSYIRVDAADVPSLQVQGAHLDGVLGTFNFLYEVIDDSYGSTPSGATDTQVKAGTFTVEATAVTDDITLLLGAIDGGTVTGSDNVEVTTPGSTVTVNLDVGSADTDGSEHVVRVVIEDVPGGVIVVGGEQVSATSWILVPPPASIGSSGATVPVQFVVSNDAGALDGHEITMQVQVKDRGDVVDYELVDPDRKEAGISWKLTTDFKGEGDAPPVIDQWEYNGSNATEDAAFSLADVIEAGVTLHAPGVTNTFTVSLTDVPPGTQVEGMTLTSVDGQPTWTAAFSVAPGANAQDVLDTFLAGITITPPENSNENNTPGGFSFNATLSGSAGGRTESATIDKADMTIPVDPVTDPAVITITAGTHDEDPLDGSIPVTISVTNPADGAFGSIVGDTLYVKVTPDTGNAGGVLWHNGVELVANDNGYYEVTVTAGDPVVGLVYVPPGGTHAGSVEFEAYAEMQEDNATNEALGTAAGTAVINLVNNGVVIDPTLPGPGDTVASGSEPDASEVSAGIELPAINMSLVDSGEEISAVMLEGVPVGFLVYVDGVLATNAGGDGSANTWVLAGGPLPGPVVVLPPPHWSGEVTGLKLLVESGETTLDDSHVDIFELGSLTVTPVANGVTLDPTHSFGIEGSIIDLNLNAAMKDSAAATASQPDGSTETTTVRLAGMGENASFYVAGVAIDGARIQYDPAGDGTYTISGLTQQELGGLGFRQLKSELTDRNADEAGLQIEVEAWTVESGNGDESSSVTDHVTLSLQAQKPGNGDDELLWTGTEIDGLGGRDVLLFRYGEDLTGKELAGNLSNIEELDLSASGANSIDDLTPAQVREILGVDNGTLVITGTSEDSVGLADGWSLVEPSGGYDVYTSDEGVTLHVSSAIGEGAAMSTDAGPYVSHVGPLSYPGDELDQPVLCQV